MLTKPRLSVILCFSSVQEVIEPTLNALYGMADLPFELFLIDDHTSDSSRQVMQSLLEHHGHEQTYYYEHPDTGGRGLRLNEVLPQCNAPALWCPESIEEVDETSLGEALDRLREEELACICTDPRLPGAIGEWMELIEKERWTGDGHFLWNIELIGSADGFFEPRARHYPGLDLAARLQYSFRFAGGEPFFEPSAPEKRDPISSTVRRELVTTLLKRYDAGPEERSRLYEFFEEFTRMGVEYPGLEHDLLVEAKKLKEAGRFSGAMELVEHVLKRDPDHSAAKKLKIEILEKRRRFVEASEVKHELEWRSSQTRKRSPGEIKTSIIIPTTAHGKHALEHCLLNLSNHCDAASTELIIIDNASLDNTHDYLEELKEKNFLNCKVITNSQNMGFAASVNQGLNRAGGEYACILHNDVEIKGQTLQRLERYLDENPQFGIIGPLADKTLNPDQSTRAWEEPDGLTATEYLDSFCMLMRTGMGVELDEHFELAFFEDIDLCFQVRDKGYKAGIATDVEVTHYLGTTTFALDLDIDSRQYWKNIAYFNEKWDIEVYSGEELRSMSTFDQLLELDELVNPVYPEPALQAWFIELFTDELRTEILKSEHEPDTLCKLVHLFMVMDEREVMRRLEDRLDDIEIPAELIYHLVRYYFDKNIYSRCLHYLNRLNPGKESFQSELYRLAIAVEEKELESAVPRLRDLLERAPSNPYLYKLAGEIYEFEGDTEEAESFYRIAAQINPFLFSDAGSEVNSKAR